MRSIEIRNARINTAGAYVCIDDYYLFAIGIQPHHGHIPVIRLGGHRKEQETAWQCAAREVYEEANLNVKALRPPKTYVSDWDHVDGHLQDLQWQHTTDPEPVPLLVVTYRREGMMHLSLMYRAQAEGLPKPSSEVRGLLLLTEQEIHCLCRESLTLEQYLCRGGRALLNAEFDAKLILEPFAQLRLLLRILRLRPEIKAI